MRESRPSRKSSKYTKLRESALKNDDQMRPKNASSVSCSRSSKSRQQSRNGLEQKVSKPDSHLIARSRGERTKQLQGSSLQSKDCCGLYDESHNNPKLCESGEVKSPQIPPQVFVLAKNKKPLMPCSLRKARKLLNSGKALVVNRFPFTIRLKQNTSSYVQDVQLKFDPGSKYTGIAIVANNKPVFLAELEHRGNTIHKNLQSRAQIRRRRRTSNLRYRPARFWNRYTPKGWLAPSLRHRLETISSWTNRLRKIIPITGISQELVKFDTQLMQNPNIKEKEYQEGTLYKYEVWEYLLERDGRKCVYCGAEGVKLEKDHVIPKAKGGTNRISNLVVACRDCNEKKGKLSLEEFLKGKLEKLRKVKSQLKASLKDTAVVNSTRFALLDMFKNTGLSIETGTGARTKFNRTRLNIPKSHALDALCVGKVGFVNNWNLQVLKIKCIGRGSHQRVCTDCYGFPRSKLEKPQNKNNSHGKPKQTKGELEKVRGLGGKRPQGFATGDMVRCLTDGKIGRITGARVKGATRVRVPCEEKDRNLTSKKLILISRTNGYDCYYD